MRPELFIGVPSFIGQITTELSDYLALLMTLSAIEQFPYDVIVNYMVGERPHEYARNKIITAALKTNAERIVMIDDDITPSQECNSIITAPYDICGAAYLTAPKGKPWASVGRKVTVVGGVENWEMAPTGTGFTHVDACGTGFIMIRRRVFQDERMQLSPPDADGTVCFFQTPRGPAGNLLLTEDLDFTYRAKKLGFSVVINHDVKCGHKKLVDVVTL